MRLNLCAFLAALLSVSGASIPARAPATPPAIYNLGTLGGTGSQGYAINDAGQVAGSSALPGDTGDIPNHAFRYDGTPGSGGVMHDLGTLGGTLVSVGLAVNDAGQVAGFSVYNNPSVPVHAFRYDGTPGSGGVMRDLGSLGGTMSRGYGINDAGQVAGYSQITGNTTEDAFRYDGTPGSGGVMRDLGTLGGTLSRGYGINNAGKVTGYSTNAGNVANHAFLYDGTPGSGGVMHDLGTLGGTYSFGLAVNDAGQVVGYSPITGDTAEHAFLYTGTPGAGGQMIDLDNWLDANNPTEGAKWTLSQPKGISNTGWVVGYGLYDPDGPGGIAAATRAYLLDASALSGIRGDFNHDGTVNAADYVVWRKGLGTTYTQEDFNT
jgi:probable HAF family extracellular repeat protein